MARLPHAAKTLRRQVLDKHPRSTVEGFGDPDGLGVVRTLRLSKSASDWLAPLLEVIDDDRMEFTGRPVADQRQEFPLTDAEEVLSGPEESGDA
jgi:hypothetical protein